jgi:hypothetical protein
MSLRRPRPAVGKVMFTAAATDVILMTMPLVSPGERTPEPLGGRGAADDG